MVRWGTDVALARSRFAASEHASVLVIGDTSHSRGRRLVHGSVARRTLRLIGPVEVYIIPPRAYRRGTALGTHERTVDRERVALPPRRRLIAWMLGAIAPVALMAVLSLARSSIGLSGALLCALLTVVAVALVGGVGPAMLATVLAVLSADFFFTVPYYGLRVAHLIDVLALLVFSVIGAVIGILVDVLAGRAAQTARFQAEAEQLARLMAGTLTDPPKPPAELVAELRGAFDLDAVGILSRCADGWQVLAGAGGQLPEHPDLAQFAATASIRTANNAGAVMSSRCVRRPGTRTRWSGMSTVLVVDDEIPLLRTIDENLRRRGYGVRVTTTGGQALAQAAGCHFSATCPAPAVAVSVVAGQTRRRQLLVTAGLVIIRALPVLAKALPVAAGPAVDAAQSRARILGSANLQNERERGDPGGSPPSRGRYAPGIVAWRGRISLGCRAEQQKRPWPPWTPQVRYGLTCRPVTG